MTTTEILKNNGFKQNFPFVDRFRKDINELFCITIQTGYPLKRTDIAEDDNFGVLYYKVTKINLPKMEIKIFKNIENVLIYVNNGNQL